ncbi:Hypothetical predicted protein, partial [Olea europaea subsp. europaea]
EIVRARACRVQLQYSQTSSGAADRVQLPSEHATVSVVAPVVCSCLPSIVCSYLASIVCSCQTFLLVVVGDAEEREEEDDGFVISRFGNLEFFGF